MESTPYNAVDQLAVSLDTPIKLDKRTMIITQKSLTHLSYIHICTNKIRILNPFPQSYAGVHENICSLSHASAAPLYMARYFAFNKPDNTKLLPRIELIKSRSRNGLCTILKFTTKFSHESSPN